MAESAREVRFRSWQLLAGPWDGGVALPDLEEPTAQRLRTAASFLAKDKGDEVTGGPTGGPSRLWDHPAPQGCSGPGLGESPAGTLSLRGQGSSSGEKCPHPVGGPWLGRPAVRSARVLSVSPPLQRSSRHVVCVSVASFTSVNTGGPLRGASAHKVCAHLEVTFRFQSNLVWRWLGPPTVHRREDQSGDSPAPRSLVLVWPPRPALPWRAGGGVVWLRNSDSRRSRGTKRGGAGGGLNHAVTSFSCLLCMAGASSPWEQRWAPLWAAWAASMFCTHIQNTPEPRLDQMMPAPQRREVPASCRHSDILVLTSPGPRFSPPLPGEFVTEKKPLPLVQP
ncbi:hypothetical protein CB1_000568090 [Camelus ferus]|nr:hypothetical protein CB1_000568090 [Camelus ferus]